MFNYELKGYKILSNLELESDKNSRKLFNDKVGLEFNIENNWLVFKAGDSSGRTSLDYLNESLKNPKILNEEHEKKIITPDRIYKMAYKPLIKTFEITVEEKENTTECDECECDCLTEF